MQYLMLIYETEGLMDAMSQEEQGAVFGEWMAYTQMLKDRGAMVAGDALQPVASATTVRVRNGARLTTDGPFAETKEQLGGYYLVDCKDLDEALELAAAMPAAVSGSVEVRPIMTFG